MNEAFGQTLGLAVGIAVSPVPIITVILILFSPAATRNVTAFLAGWLLGLTGVGLVVLLSGLGSGDSGADRGAAVAIIVGLLLLFLAARQWRRRPRAGVPPKQPKWMAAVDGFSAPRAFGLALILTAVNPKNLGLTVAAATLIAAADPGGPQELAALAIFVLIASLGVIAPAAAYLLARERAETALDSAKDWLVANNSTVMTVIFLVLGAVVLGNGLAGFG